MAGDACIHNIISTCKECRKTRNNFPMWLADQKDFGDLSPREISIAIRAWLAGETKAKDEIMNIFKPKTSVQFWNAQTWRFCPDCQSKAFTFADAYKKDSCICMWIKSQIEQVPLEHRTALEDAILAKFDENNLTVADLFELQASANKHGDKE